MDRERLDALCEKGILLLVLAALAYAPLAFGAVRAVDAVVLQSLAAGILLVWAARAWLQDEFRFLWPPVCTAVVLFLLYAAWRYSAADVEYVARLELLRVLVYAVFFFAAINNLNRQEAVQGVVFALVCIGLALSVYAVFQFLTHSEFVLKFLKPASYSGRGSGTYVCPNHLAGFLEMALPLALAWTISGRLAHPVKILLGYSALVMLAGIGVTLSRGGWLATLAGLMLFVALSTQRRGIRLPAIVFLGMLTLGAVWMVFTAQESKDRFKMLYQSGKFEDTRFHLWKPAVQMWKDHPWTGVGPAHFDTRFGQYRPELVQRRPERVHNDYLNTLADWGAAGFALVLAAWTLLFAGAWKAWRFVTRSQNDLAGGQGNRAAFLLGAGVGLATLLAHSFVDFNFHIPANALVAVTLMALVASHARYVTERAWLAPGRFARIAFTLLAVAGALGFLRLSIQRMTEDALLRRGTRVREASLDYIAFHKQAHVVEPGNPMTAYRIGEAYRVLSFTGGEGYDLLAKDAMQWFERAAALDKRSAYPPMRTGMCLDWLGRHDEAAAHFELAAKLDPNNYFIVAHIGWHFAQTGDWATAKRHFERSLKLEPNQNPIATSYLEIANDRLKRQQD
jgi:O-antigen ligase